MATSETYEPIERASIDELRALQSERLRATVARAYANVDHYRAAFDAVGVHPDAVTGLDDLARLPFLVKDDLRQSYPFGLFAVPRSNLRRVHASSGTSGKPTVVGYTANDIDTWASVVARSLFAAGARPGDLLHNAYGYGLFTGGLGAHYGAERLGCTVVPFGGGQTERQGHDPQRCSLEVGVFGAEPWSEALRHEIEDRLGIDAVDIYGLSEVIGPGVAQECVETKDGLTIWEDHFFPEIINPETGEVLPDGEVGELVLTSLTKEALPVIRYRTGDITALRPGTARTMRRLDRITGRNDDMLIIRGVNVYPSQIEAELLQVPGVAPHYQLQVGQDGNLATLTVVVERDPSGLADDDLTRARQAEERIKTMIGVSTTVQIVEPDALPRSQGKAQRVTR